MKQDAGRVGQEAIQQSGSEPCTEWTFCAACGGGLGGCLWECAVLRRGANVWVLMGWVLLLRFTLHVNAAAAADDGGGGGAVARHSGTAE
eukprot:scaffold46089_cov24-Tisochrysis_lutea.AAC.3